MRWKILFAFFVIAAALYPACAFKDPAGKGLGKAVGPGGVLGSVFVDGKWELVYNSGQFTMSCKALSFDSGTGTLAGDCQCMAGCLTGDVLKRLAYTCSYEKDGNKLGCSCDPSCEKTIPPEPVLEPQVETVPEKIPEPVKETVVEPQKEPIQEALVEPVKEPVAEPVKEPVKETVVESVTEPVKEAVVEPVKESINEMVVEPIKETATEQVQETVTEPIKETVTETVAELPKEAVVEAPKEAVVEPVKEVVNETVAEPLKEAVMDAGTEQETIPEPRQETVPETISCPAGQVKIDNVCVCPKMTVSANLGPYRCDNVLSWKGGAVSPYTGSLTWSEVSHVLCAEPDPTKTGLIISAPYVKNDPVTGRLVLNPVEASVVMNSNQEFVRSFTIPASGCTLQSLMFSKGKYSAYQDFCWPCHMYFTLVSRGIYPYHDANAKNGAGECSTWYTDAASVNTCK